MAYDLKSKTSLSSQRVRTTLLQSQYLGLALALALFSVVSLILILQGVSLGHDEALYATRARQFLTGEPVSPWWSANRAPGLSFLLTLAWLGEGTEPYLRLVVALFGAALVMFTWLLGRLLVDEKAAVIAACGIALSPVILMSSTQVWPDIPGAAVGAAALFLYARGLVAESPRWWLVPIVASLVGFATTVRFGAPIPLTVGLVGLTLWRWPRRRIQKVFVMACALGVVAVVSLLLLTPSISEGAIPLQGIADRSENNPLYQGFQDYWSMRSRLYTLSTVVSLAGVFAGVLLSMADASFRRVFMWPFLIFLMTFAGIATFVHGELRYLSPVVPWLWISAAAGLAGVASRMPMTVSGVAGFVTLLVLALAAPSSSDDAVRLNVGFQTIENAARSLATGEECGVFTSYTPQVEWYSECKAVVINRYQVVIDSESLPDGPRYLLFVENGKRQPEGEVYEGYVAETTGTPRAFHPLDPERRSVEIWEINP